MLARVTLTAGKKTAGVTAAKEARRALHATRAAAFLVRGPEDVATAGRVVKSEDGKHSSERYLVRADDTGFSMQREVVQKGATVRLVFANHAYAALVTRGEGRVRLLEAAGHVDEGEPRRLAQGSLLALNAAEVAELTAGSAELELVSVMNPPLFGAEQRQESGVFPVVDADGVEHEAFDHSAVQRLFEVPSALKGGSKPMKDDPLF